VANSERSIVGDLINFRGLVYAPLNENGVVFLFGKVAEDLNMYIEEIKPGFPDCIARRFTGKGWERVRVEFEFRSSNFQQHRHNPAECDIIICWEHDWINCPIEVIELRDRIKEMPNPPIKRPEDTGTGVSDGTIDSWFERCGVQKSVQKQFEMLHNYVTSLNDESFFKVGEKLVSFYCPERVFIYLAPRKSMLRLNLFTRGQPLGNVKQFAYERGGDKWGGLSLATDDDLKAAMPWIKESYDRIRQAVANNESTGWFAKLEDEADEDQ